MKLPITPSQLRKVLYGPDKVQRTELLLNNMLNTLDEYLGPLVSIPDPPAQAHIQTILLGTVAGYVEKLRYLYKSEAYDYETECRFVIPESDTDKDLIRFEYQEQDESNIRIRHYYEIEELKLHRILVTDSEIRLGPRVINPDNVRYYLSALLRKAGLPGPKITTSDIPYRRF